MIRCSYAACAVLFPLMLSAADFTPPPTRTEPVTEVIHGVAVTDPYRWLENQNSPETRAWLEAQEKFARGYLDSIPGRDALRRKLEALIRIDSVGTPTLRGGRYLSLLQLQQAAIAGESCRRYDSWECNGPHFLDTQVAFS